MGCGWETSLSGLSALTQRIYRANATKPAAITRKRTRRMRSKIPKRSDFQKGGGLPVDHAKGSSMSAGPVVVQLVHSLVRSFVSRAARNVGGASTVGIDRRCCDMYVCMYVAYRYR